MTACRSCRSRGSDSGRAARPGTGDPEPGLAGLARRGLPGPCRDPRSAAAAVVDAAGGRRQRAGRAGHPGQADRPHRSAIQRCRAEHRGDGGGGQRPRVWPVPGDSGQGNDDHPRAGPGPVHLRPPAAGVLRERGLAAAPRSGVRRGTPDVPFPSDQPGFDKVTMADFFSPAARQAQTTFHHARIELHLGEIDKLW